MKQGEINEVLRLHHLWLEGELGGIKANLREANLREADLREANLERANLERANLERANLRWANLEGADLKGANLREADLERANLERADLREADLREANWDFSSLPLWCGGSCFKTDLRLVNQLLAHICTFEVDSEEFAELKKLIIPYAVKSHRAKDLELED